MHSIDDDIRDKRTDQLARGFPVGNAETQEMRPSTGKGNAKGSEDQSQKSVIKHGVDKTTQEATKYDL
jgi:hypothetical protein